VADFAVADSGRLVEAAARLHFHQADPLVLEYGRALEHVDELQPAKVPVPLAMRRLAGPGADHVRHHLAAGRALDAEVAILEVGAQSAPHEFRPRLVADGKVAFHVRLLNIVARVILQFYAFSD